MSASMEVTALEKYGCAACGARAEWNPARQALLCPYCGTEAPAELDQQTGQIREIELARALREMPDELRGWKAAKHTVRCQSCEAISVFNPERVGQSCDFCGSPSLIDYEEIKAPIRPQSLLPFKISREQVRAELRRWFAGKWLAPGRLKTRALVDTVQGVYLPYWTFDAQVECPWIAQSGTYYYTTETYRTSGGRRATRQVRHVRWRPSSGQIEHFFDDEPIPGTRGVSPDHLRRIEPFPTDQLIPYDTAFLSGFVVEHYQVVLIAAAHRAREQMKQRLYQLCSREVPGDTFRALEIFPEFSAETFKHFLVPVWLLVYNYGANSYQVLVNGYTGEIAGKYPRSWWKIAFLILVGLVAVLMVAVMSQL